MDIPHTFLRHLASCTQSTRLNCSTQCQPVWGEDAAMQHLCDGLEKQKHQQPLLGRASTAGSCSPVQDDGKQTQTGSSLAMQVCPTANKLVQNKLTNPYKLGFSLYQQTLCFPFPSPSSAVKWTKSKKKENRNPPHAVPISPVSPAPALESSQFHPGRQQPPQRGCHAADSHYMRWRI